MDGDWISADYFAACWHKQDELASRTLRVLKGGLGKTAFVCDCEKLVPGEVPIKSSYWTMVNELVESLVINRAHGKVPVLNFPHSLLAVGPIIRSANHGR